jgi:anion transporter
VIDLGATRLFAGLKPLDLARLLPELEERTFPAGSIVFHAGDVGDALYVVRAGLAEARAGAGGVGDASLAVFEAGDNFGEMAVLTDDPRSTTIVALTDLDVWVLPRERFRRLVEEAPSVALAVGRLLSRRLHTSNQAVSTLRQAFGAVADQRYRELPTALQDLLRRIAPLDPIPVDLVAAAVARPDAGALLAALAARVPFLVAEGGGVYRCHRLFRELLQDKLRAEVGPAAYRGWLGHLAAAAQGLGHVEQAVALFLAAGDRDAAEGLVRAHARRLLERGEAEALEQLLAGLPADIDGSRGELADLRAEGLVARGCDGEAVAVLEEAERKGGGAAEAADAVRLAGRYRRLAELHFKLGHAQEGMRWLRRSSEADPDGRQALSELEQLLPLARNGAPGADAREGLMALASLSALRRASAPAGVLGHLWGSRPLGTALAVLLLGWFALTAPPPGLSREAYLAFGLLAAALPLLVFSVLADHLITLLMVAGWAGLGLVPPRVALGGFATPGWFLVLAVLAIGVALSRSGLLYRLVLALAERVPQKHVALSLAFAAVGVLFSPAMPNATGRTALAAPLVAEMATVLGYGPRSRGSAALAMAALLGFGQMCSLFVTGSSSGLLVHSLLPPESRARFGWVTWFLAALPLHLVIFAVTYAAVLVRLPADAEAPRSRARIRAQRELLGPMTRAERIAAAVFVALVLAFVAGPLLGLEPAWAAVLAMVLLAATNILDQQGFKSGINWAFLIFFGGMLSLAEVFRVLGVDAWLAASIASPLAPLAAQPAVFLVALGLAGYLVNLVVRWQAACVLMTLVLVPAVGPLGVEPWVVGITALVTTNTWFLPYQSTIYQALYYGTDERAFGHAQARPIALAYGVACLLGLLASIPLWRAMGLLP